jgi:hypothetical protein
MRTGGTGREVPHCYFGVGERASKEGLLKMAWRSLSPESCPESNEALNRQNQKIKIDIGQNSQGSEACLHCNARLNQLHQESD